MIERDLGKNGAVRKLIAKISAENYAWVQAETKRRQLTAVVHYTPSLTLNEILTAARLQQESTEPEEAEMVGRKPPKRSRPPLSNGAADEARAH